MDFPRPKIVFSDFDGTLTYGHELRSCFFEIVELLQKHEIPLVIVTGRSKSWSHFMLSHFSSLQWMISEGGGVLTKKEWVGNRGKMSDELYVEEREVLHLDNMAKKLKVEFPEVEFSVDSFGRQTDRAIELSWLEDNPEQFEKIKDFLSKEGINYSTSNVHLNFWCGKVAKSLAIKRFMKENLKSKNIAPDEYLFFGDSLNDETAFKALPHCVGVANIDLVIDRLTHKPSVILEGEENKGPYGVLNYLLKVLK
jgi:HAD superfamily hydrolase (TIGR01484 family)